MVDDDPFGLLPIGDAAVQIDITSVLRQVGPHLVETFLCDHNCTVSDRGRLTGGHYTCPAAFTLNRGAVRSTTATAELLREGINRVVAAARAANASYLADGFAAYAEVFRIPAPFAERLRTAMSRSYSQVTLFGGSPEAHPQILDLVSGLAADGHGVHITMTGRRAIRDPRSFHRLAATGLEVVAVSIDDVELGEIERLLDMDDGALRGAWKAIPPQHGQRQKVFEAVHLARVWQQLPAKKRPALLINMAVHAGNVGNIQHMLDALTEAVPGASLNPFPMQSAFDRRDYTMDAASLNEFASFVERMIAQHCARAADLSTVWSFVPRLHYWLMVAAALRSPRPADRVRGWGTWQCYRSAGAARYIQVAGTGREVPAESMGPAGGRVGCFWNSMLNDHSMPPIWEAAPDQLRRYLELRPTRAVGHPASCPGCLFPRLVGDMVSAESGMDPQLRGPYLSLRRAHIGF